MEALASIRELKRSGGKGDEEIFMNFGDIFVAGKKGKVEEQLKVITAAFLFRPHIVSLAHYCHVTLFTSQSEQATFTSEIDALRQQVTNGTACLIHVSKGNGKLILNVLCYRSRLKLQLYE